MAPKPWFVYVIRKRDRYYTGITTNLRHRMKQHGVSNALHVERAPSAPDAAKREREIKGWSRAKKEKLWNRA